MLEREQRAAELFQSSESERSTKMIVRTLSLVDALRRKYTHVGSDDALLSSRREPIRSQILVISSLPSQLPFFPINIEQRDRPNDVSEYKSVTRSRHALKHVGVVPFRQQLNMQRVLPFFHLHESEYLDLKTEPSINPSYVLIRFELWTYCGVDGQRQSVPPGNHRIYAALNGCTRDKVQ